KNIKIMENLKSLKIYELFPGEKEQDYYAIHTLTQLFNPDKYYLKNCNIKKLDETFDKIKSIKEFLSEFSIRPYLMLNNLDDDKKEKEVLDKIVYGIIPNFRFYNEPKEIIKKINPYENKGFIKKLLFTITEEDNQRFDDSLKAEKLFYLYNRKEHIPLIMESLKLHSKLYNRYSQSRESLDD
ncbi:MAG: hypothetical protein AABX44_00135, partial [Nanoarchaeota archaeon]